jgi:carbonic anhydrase/acetyltransferase-like protein (isoleucine patch superfamily)
MAVYRIGSRRPLIHAGAYVSREAVVIGHVEIEEGVSIWPGAVIRGDNEKITIRRDANVQDGAVIHVDPGFPVVIGEGVSIGHQAMLHGCTVGQNCLIGIQAVVLNGAMVDSNSLVGAGALIGEGKSFPSRSLIVGAPARVLRELTDEVIAKLRANALDYRERGMNYSKDLERID